MVGVSRPSSGIRQGLGYGVQNSDVYFHSSLRTTVCYSQLCHVPILSLVAYTFACGRGKHDEGAPGPRAEASELMGAEGGGCRRFARDKSCCAHTARKVTSFLRRMLECSL